LAGTGSALGPPHRATWWLITSRQRLIIGVAILALAGLGGLRGQGAVLPSAAWQAAFGAFGFWLSAGWARAGAAARAQTTNAGTAAINNRRIDTPSHLTVDLSAAAAGSVSACSERVSKSGIRLSDQNAREAKNLERAI
jgi:hypothetical protein